MPKFNFAAVNKLFDTIAADATQHAFALMGSGVDGAGRNKAPIERMIKRLQDLEVAAANGLPYKDPIDTETRGRGGDKGDLISAALISMGRSVRKEADETTEKNGRTWNRDLQGANGMIGDAYRSGNMKSAKDYFAHLKTLRAQLANEIAELNMNLDMADKMISERDRMLFEGSPGEHKEASEKWKPPTPEELLASYTTEAEDYIAKMARSEKRIASGQPASPSSILQVTSAADSLRISINKLSDPAAKALSKRLRDGIKSLLSASDAELKRGSVDGPYRAVYKEAPERPTLPSGRYADVDPGRLMGLTDE